ncbi:methyltransferase domain-containing protein [Candidatus Woesearchaeota archaeon]|nr:methyltransferase domain-containing protein [Candidatus Woesearchaeota archaeon]
MDGKIDGKKALFSSSGKHIVTDLTKDFHTKDGFITAADLQLGGKVKSSKNIEFHVVPATFSDLLEKINRHAQIISRKDIGMILATACVDSSSLVVDAGAGSGMLSCLLSKYVKSIVAYDIDPRSLETTRKNVDKLGLKNVTVKEGNVYEKIDESNVDLVTLDLPSPWLALANACAALKPGGFLAVYSPQIIQSQQTVIEAEKHALAYVKTIELIERSWALSERQCRPGFDALGHTGFLSFFRRV